MLDKSFDPKTAEADIYARWESSGAFKPRMDTSREAFSIVIPPPNVTGSLHMGHALNNTLQDILVRFERMRGKDVLWQPGTDHAGIATQMVVERQMAAEGGKARKDMSREDFEAKVWEWKEKSGGTITSQLRRLGASCDWSRERFTLDDGLSDAVKKVFVQMYDEGLIYRDKRLVNWDPHFQTAISDLEVEMKEVDGHYWHLRYPLADGRTYEHPITDEDGNVTGHETRNYIVVATSRPETMLGDTGVAVHPDDERYAALVGTMVDLPIVGRQIPIVADEYADPEKGSGAVKITPAHDFNDYDVGKRAGLKVINILDSEAKILDAEGCGIPAEYIGKSTKDARKMVVEAFEKAGLLDRIEDLKIEQPFGDRSGVVIEPWLTDQWYVDAKTLAKDAIAAVDNGTTRFVPENWKKTYDNWMHDIQPWCISRQLWWGHRVPVWYGPTKEEIEDHNSDSRLGQPFVGICKDEVVAKAKLFYGQNVDVDFFEDRAAGDMRGISRDGETVTGVTLSQDPDVLDTWFSSALWPFSTLGWPETTEELERFYPTSVVITAFDIIFFWVARMMMQGIKFMGEVPFKDIYIHALVLDEHGQKMSKSKGNVVDPLELIDTYGADALRFSMASQAAQGRNVRLSTQRVEGYRNFGTKLWNAARFGEMNDVKHVEGFEPSGCTQAVNLWIADEAAKACADITDALEKYRFNDAADAAYKFAWGTYCDWYLELIKPVMGGEDAAAKAETQACAAWAFDTILKMLHPFMPFITEALWAQTAESRETDLILADWPVIDAGAGSAAAGEDINWLIRTISELRSVRAEMNVPPSRKSPLVLIGASDETKARMDTYADVLSRMARVENWIAAEKAPKGSIQAVVDEATMALPLAGLIDLGEERARLEKEIAKVDGEVAKIDGKLKNKNFVDRAPAAVVAEQHTRREAFTSELGKLKAALANLPPA